MQSPNVVTTLHAITDVATLAAITECGDDVGCNHRWQRRRYMLSPNVATTLSAIKGGDDDGGDNAGLETDLSQNGYGGMLMVMLMMLIMVAISFLEPPPSLPQFDEQIASSLEGGGGSGCAP